MPEGDTIRYAVNRIRPVLEGQIPDAIETPQLRHAFDNWPARLAGRAVRAVDAHGKHLFLRFDGELVLHSHLGMSGAWAVYRRGERWRRSPKHAWLVLRCDGHEVVQFGGPTLELMSEFRARTDRRLAGLGPDILAERFDADAAIGRLRAGDAGRLLGDALLEQRTLAGIGNIWKSESCFAAAVDPWRATGECGDGELREILRFAREQMSVSAREGFSARPHAVYRRAGEPCRRCTDHVRSRGQGDQNRTTYWCPGCQR